MTLSRATGPGWGPSLVTARKADLGNDGSCGDDVTVAVAPHHGFARHALPQALRARAASVAAAPPGLAGVSVRRRAAAPTVGTLLPSTSTYSALVGRARTARSIARSVACRMFILSIVSTSTAALQRMGRRRPAAPRYEQALPEAILIYKLPARCPDYPRVRGEACIGGCSLRDAQLLGVPHASDAGIWRDGARASKHWTGQRPPAGLVHSCGSARYARCCHMASLSAKDCRAGCTHNNVETPGPQRRFQGPAGHAGLRRLCPCRKGGFTGGAGRRGRLRARQLRYTTRPPHLTRPPASKSCSGPVRQFPSWTHSFGAAAQLCLTGGV